MDRTASKLKIKKERHSERTKRFKEEQEGKGRKRSKRK